MTSVSEAGTEFIHISDSEYAEITDGLGEAKVYAYLKWMSVNNITISAGNHHTLGLSVEGKPFSFGENYSGIVYAESPNHYYGSQLRLKLGRISGADLEPNTELDGTGRDTLTVEENACYIEGLAVNHAGIVYGWGGNSYGALAQGTATTSGSIYKVSDIENILIPEVIVNLSTGSEIIGNDRIISFQGGSRNAQGLSLNGDVYSWGDMGTGYMGNGYDVDELGIERQLALMPVKVSALDDVFVVSISANTSSHFAVTDENVVYAWGSTADGRLSVPQDICSDINTELYSGEAPSSVCYTPIEVNVIPNIN